jgi:hypothetical protein
LAGHILGKQKLVPGTNTMETSLKDKIIYAFLSIAISFGGIYFFMIEPLDSKAKSKIKSHLEGSNYGPFDEAWAKSAGMEDLLKKKPKLILPKSNPITFPENW